MSHSPSRELDLGPLHRQPARGARARRQVRLGGDREGQGLAAASGAVQRVGAVGLHERLVDRLARGLRDPDRLVEGGGAALVIAEREQRDAEPVEDRRADVVGVDRAGRLERLLRLVLHLQVAALEHQERHPAAEQLRPLGTAVAVRQQGERAPQRGAALLAAAERPLGAGELAEHLGQRVRVGVGPPLVLGDRLAQQLRAPVVVDVGAVRGGGAHEDVGVRGARERLRVGHAVPDLQRALEQARGLAVGVHAPGGGGGLHARLQRRRLVARGAEVVRHPGRDPDAVGAGLRPALERAREREVQLRVLARQQVVVDDLAQQRVAEAVHAVRAGDDQVRGDRLAQRRRAARRPTGPPRRPAARGRRAGRPPARAGPPARPRAGAPCGPSARRAASAAARRRRRRRPPAAPR